MATNMFALEDEDVSEMDEDGILKPKNSEETEFGDGGLEDNENEDPEVLE